MIENHNTLIVIPARMASARLPGKPLANLNGQPMILHVWRRAVEAGIGPVVVCTDTAEIVQAVEGAGGSVVSLQTYGRTAGGVTGAVTRLNAKAPYDAVLVADAGTTARRGRCERRLRVPDLRDRVEASDGPHEDLSQQLVRGAAHPEWQGAGALG